LVLLVREAAIKLERLFASPPPLTMSLLMSKRDVQVRRGERDGERSRDGERWRVKERESWKEVKRSDEKRR
jgi:hypothetical protein